jgi:hypothetical protein
MMLFRWTKKPYHQNLIRHIVKYRANTGLFKEGLQRSMSLHLGKGHKLLHGDNAKIRYHPSFCRQSAMKASEKCLNRVS